ncbi:hypothetical protein, partial [Streptococcus agalactiae]|uniref:hypothetical protein n=1 Tax=Streptococcus agalactiae TaxID=1311 RepID=UPI000ABFD2CF
VAPFAGAWIEIISSVRLLFRFWSHPLRVRGLKLFYIKNKTTIIMSHPLRVRGLKLIMIIFLLIHYHRPFAGV